MSHGASPAPASENVMLRPLILGMLAVGSIGMARAADPPSLAGTWTGSGASVSKSDDWQTDRAYTLEITDQRGQVFKGINRWQGGEDEVFGVLRGDGVSVLLSNSDGESTAVLLDPDTMEICYVEGGEDAMATCATLSRKQ
jgi:hypothetical protein